jgi:hypothetical protein
MVVGWQRMRGRKQGQNNKDKEEMVVAMVVVLATA